MYLKLMYLSAYAYKTIKCSKILNTVFKCNGELVSYKFYVYA